MSRFSTAEVRRVADLSRIALTEAEVERLAGELAAITASVAKVSEVATPDVVPTSHPMPIDNVFRPDVVGAVLDRAEVLAAAPAAEDGQFQVPQILQED